MDVTKIIIELNLAKEEITTLRQQLAETLKDKESIAAMAVKLSEANLELTLNNKQLAEQPKVDLLVEALKRLIDTSNDADGFGYGTLSTTFVRDIATQSLATYQSKNEKE